jgi:hypothetical protein
MLASSLLVSSVSAVGFTWTPDDAGPNDEPGQKDLTSQASAFDAGSFYTAWRWDDTSWSGKNTGDACALFDTDANGLVDFAVCVTVATKNATEQSTRVYSCKDTRSDRCTGAVLEGSQPSDGSGDWCSISYPEPSVFDPNDHSTDTQATCNISLVDSDISDVSGLGNATLLNSCSYPSQEPNSDPSDCVITIANVDVTVSTLSSGGITWTATLSDSATLNPTSATGSVVFKLYSGNPCVDPDPTADPPVAGNLVWTSGADNAAPFNTAGGGAGTPANGNVITGTGPTTNLTYYWIATYTPTGAFNGDDSACGEATVINASVVGASGS